MLELINIETDMNLLDQLAVVHINNSHWALLFVVVQTQTVIYILIQKVKMN